MFKYINKHGQQVCSGGSVLTPTMFYKVDMPWADAEDKQWAFHTKKISLTVVHRMTGFGFRDIETGFRDEFGEFWLVTGGFDIRTFLPLTLAEAIALVKQRANTCIGRETLYTPNTATTNSP